MALEKVNEETITIFGSAITLTAEVQIYLMCFLCIYQVYAGKGRRGELRGIYSEAFDPGFCNVSCMQAKCANE